MIELIFILCTTILVVSLNYTKVAEAAHSSVSGADISMAQDTSLPHRASNSTRTAAHKGGSMPPYRMTLDMARLITLSDPLDPKATFHPYRDIVTFAVISNPLDRDNTHPHTRYRIGYIKGKGQPPST